MDNEQLKAMMTIMAWQQIQITSLRNILCAQRTLSGKAHLQEFRSMAIHLNDFTEIIEETMQMLQDPTRIEEVFARLQGFDDLFQKRKHDIDGPAL